MTIKRTTSTLSKSFALLILIVCILSCKKNNTSNSNNSSNNNTNTATTYTNVTIQIALLDETFGQYVSGSFSANRLNHKAIVHCNNLAIDSLVGLDTTQTNNHFFDACNAASMHINTKTFKVQVGSVNYLDVYDNGVLMGSAIINITHTPQYLQPVNVAGTSNFSGSCGAAPFLGVVIN